MYNVHVCAKVAGGICNKDDQRKILATISVIKKIEGSFEIMKKIG